MQFEIPEQPIRLTLHSGEIYIDLQARSKDFKELDQRIRERARQLLLEALPVDGVDDERLADLRRAVDDHTAALTEARQRVEDLTSRRASAQGPGRAAMLAAIERDLLRAEFDVADSKAAMEQARLDLAAAQGDAVAVRERLTGPVKSRLAKLKQRALADLARDAAEPLAELLALYGVLRELDRHADEVLRAPLAEAAR